MSFGYILMMFTIFITLISNQFSLYQSNKKQYLKKMECPMCYDIYDESHKIPRNLFCGHTACQQCLTNSVKSKGRLQCPICRLKHDVKLKPNQLTKNYIALEFSRKQRQLLQKHEFCVEHKQPLKFYCQNDSQYICIDCITKHTGHRFFKQQQSIVLVKKNLANKMQNLKDELNRIKNIEIEYLQATQLLTKKYQVSINENQKTFNNFRRQLNLAEERIKIELKKFFENEVVELQKSKIDLKKQTNSIQKEIKILQERMQSLEKLKVIQQKVQLSDYRPKKFRNALDAEFPILTFSYLELPKIQLNYKINPKICFFGQRKKLLTLCPTTNEYALTTLVTPIEIQYYSACCTLPSGEILITGGGSSNFTLLFNAWIPNNNKLIYKKNMISCRKEHSCVYMNGLVYAISGYDSKNKCMAGCQVYDINKDEWKVISGLNTPRCAFAAAVVQNKIWVLGGFNGTERIKSIQMYQQSLDVWKIVNVQLKMPLSNSAAVGIDNSIIILGGGCNEGFSLQTYQFDINQMTIKQISKMDTGRDLRNKTIVFKGQIYAIGGNNFSAQKLRIRAGRWQTLKGYGDLIQDNLDSWCCGLTYNPNDYDLQKFSLYNNNLKKKYLEYAYQQKNDEYEEME